ncbi:MAG TPA: hydrogen peroxide-dependent heme synthase [Bacillota bacterium]
MTALTTAPETLEGWWALHDIRRIDWPRWKQVAAGERAEIIAEAQAFCERVLRVADAPEGSSGLFRVLGQKGDWMLLHLRPSLEQLSALEQEFARTRLADFLLPAYSFVSIVELSRHAAAAGDVADLAQNEYVRGRLYPQLPAVRTVCFYPMSKKREGDDNWYTLSPERRRVLMRDHGMVGRKYAEHVTQIITGATGLDDWEWGVTLFADDPLWFKKLVYEMRFDEASARYALFGPFFIGIRMEPGELASLLAV